MDLIASGLGSDHDVGAAVTTRLGGGAQGDSAEFLDVIGIESLEIGLGIGHSGFIRVDAVDGDVVRAIARTENVGSGTGRTAGALDDARFERQQGERVAAVQRQVLHLFFGNDVADGGVGGLN